MKKFQARQGDVFIQQTDQSIPKQCKRVQKDAGRTVLAYGEVTGHAHAFGGKKQPLLFRAGDDALTAYIRIDGVPCSLQHDEHAPIEHPTGTYEVIQQRQWTLSRQIRRVAD